jgi:hypothetical protein
LVNFLCEDTTEAEPCNQTNIAEMDIQLPSGNPAYTPLGDPPPVGDPRASVVMRATFGASERLAYLAGDQGAALSLMGEEAFRELFPGQALQHWRTRYESAPAQVK